MIDGKRDWYFEVCFAFGAYAHGVAGFGEYENAGSEFVFAAGFCDECVAAGRAFDGLAVPVVVGWTGGRRFCVRSTLYVAFDFVFGYGHCYVLSFVCVVDGDCVATL